MNYAKVLFITNHMYNVWFTTNTYGKLLMDFENIFWGDYGRKPFSVFVSQIMRKDDKGRLCTFNIEVSYLSTSPSTQTHKLFTLNFLSLSTSLRLFWSPVCGLSWVLFDEIFYTPKMSNNRVIYPNSCWTAQSHERQIFVFS